MSTKNFDLSEVIFCGGDDPEPGTTWRNWWDGGEPKIPSYFAHLMYWLLHEATDCFITPDGTWDQLPERYKPIDGDASSAIEYIDQDITQYFEVIASLPARNGYLIEPYEFESTGCKNEFLAQDFTRSLAVYVIYCVDTAFGALMAGNASIAASAVAFANVGLDTMRSEMPQNQVKQSGSVVRSELGKHAAGYRHEPTRAMKKEAIRLYCEKKDWRSRRQAAKSIYPLVQAYGKDQHNHQLSADRAEQTVYEWLTEHDKKTKVLTVC